MTGRTHREAATAAGVHRVTVTNWQNEDPVFAAEHNRRKTELREGVAAQLLNLTQKSLESVAASVETEQAEGGSVIALRVLGLLDLRRFPVPKPGPTDPYDVEQKWQDDAEAESVDRFYGHRGFIHRTHMEMAKKALQALRESRGQTDSSPDEGPA
jgi:hypothetical protein